MTGSDKTTSQFGELIKGARQARGMTIRDLENRTGISNATICQLETGASNNPTASTLIALHEELLVSYAAMIWALEQDHAN